MTTIVIAAVSAGVLGLLLSTILIISSKVFHVETDERVQIVLDSLPGVNCGACGEASCAALAEKIAKDEAAIDACVPGGIETAKKIASVLGKEASAEKEKKRAYIFCRGGESALSESVLYSGAPSCKAAHLTGGERGCSFGCLGFGDCVEACPFGAIVLGESLLPKVIVDKCTACGNCVKACPKNLIEIHPVNQEVHIYCKSLDRGPLAKKNCPSACIACTLCVKKGPENGASMLGDLAVINYESYSWKKEDLANFKCPTNAINADKPNTL